jgi:hypothetical protein
MAGLNTIDSPRQDERDWQPVNPLSYPWCLLLVQIYMRDMRWQQTTETFLPTRAEMAKHLKDHPRESPPVAPSFDLASMGVDLATLTPDKRIMMELESRSLGYQAKLGEYQAQQAARSIPKNRWDWTPMWRPLRFVGQNEKAYLGGFVILCRPQQAIQFLSAAEPGLVLLQRLVFRGHGPKGPWWVMNPWRYHALQSPFLRPVVFVPTPAPPHFPLQGESWKVKALNEKYSEKGLWTLAESPNRNYDPVADGM